MRVSLLLFVLSVALLANTVNSQIKIAGLLELGVRFILLNLKRAGNLTLTDDTTLIVPESLKSIIAGKIRLQEPTVCGLESLNIINLVANDIDTLDNSIKVNLCLNLAYDQLLIRSQYDADIGIINEIPIYGDGNFGLAISKTDVDLCLNINIAERFSQLYVDELLLNLKFRDSPSYITRFWKNKSVSEFVTVIINILEKFVCMWMSYENECISCVLSPVVQYIVNDILPNNYENRLDIDCACLKGALGNKFGITYNVEEKLERLIYSYYQGNITNELTNKDVNNVKDIFEVVTNSIIEILNKEGVAFDV